MKIKKIILPLLILPMLFACGGTKSDSQDSSSVTSSSRVPESSFPTVSTTPVSDGCQYSGSIVEINTGTFLQTNDSYGCAISPTYYTNKAIKVVSSNEEIFTIKMDERSQNSFFIETHAVGDAILKVYAAEDDYLLYRNVVHVRTPYSPQEIQEVVFDTYDIWKSTGIYGNYTMSFFQMKPLKGLLYGKDDMESTTLNYELEFVETKKLYDFTFHSYRVIVDNENSSTRRTYTEFDIATTGDNILIFYDEGLLEIFRPDTLMQSGRY